MSRPLILLDISAFLLYCFLVSPLVYQFISSVLIFLCIYLFIYFMFVLYLQNSFCKPLQISQIEYSDGLVPKKKMCLLLIHVSIDSCSQLFTFVYFFIRLFDYLFAFSLILHCLKVFYIFPSLNFLYLFSIYSSSLFPVYSFFYIFRPFFCIVSWFLHWFINLFVGC